MNGGSRTRTRVISINKVVAFSWADVYKAVIGVHALLWVQLPVEKWHKPWSLLTIAKSQDCLGTFSQLDESWSCGSERSIWSVISRQGRWLPSQAKYKACIWNLCLQQDPQIPSEIIQGRRMKQNEVRYQSFSNQLHGCKACARSNLGTTLFCNCKKEMRIPLKCTNVA